MKKELRVLIIEDSEDDARFLVRELERAGIIPTYKVVAKAPQLAQALDDELWDVIVSDHSMPGFSSMDALRMLREKGQDIPFIVVSGAIGEDTAVNLMKAGASDYVMKGRTARLVPAIERELREADGRQARRTAEDALARNRQELEDFFDNAPLGLRWDGPDGVILRANDAELKMLGYSREEYVGHNIAEFHLDKSVAADVLRRLKTGETLEDYEARLRCKDGSIRDVVINSNALCENGKFIHSRSFTRDVTTQKLTQTALAYLAAIVKSSEDAIIGTTLEGIILTWNAGADRVYGYTADEVRGRSISLLVPSNRPQELPELYEKLRRGEAIERYETVRVRKDGAPIDISLTLSPIKDAEGKLIGVSAIERDITVRMRETHERLQLIQELTDALANIKTLSGLLPICAACKRIRDDHGYWQKVESYIADHTQAEFTHGICPECAERLYPEYRSPNSN